MSFVHLHSHTEYSILDSLIKVKQLVAKAKEFNQNAVAFTDHGNMYAVFEFWKECHEQGIKPIIGCELNVANKSHLDRNAVEKTYSVVALAKNLEGYHNLVKLVSAGFLEGFYYKPRVDKELLEKYKDNLIILSSHEYSEIRQHYILGDEDKAEQTAKWYKNVFGENYYIELVRVGNDHEEELNNKLINLAKKLDIKLVAAGDTHYLLPEDYAPREIIWAISDGKKLTDPTRRQDKTHNYYMKTSEQMLETWKDMPDILENSQKIADEIEDYKITYGIVQPKFNKIPDSEDRGLLVRKLAYEGAKNLYGEITPEVKARLEYELEILHEKGFDEYLLVVQDYANEARKRGIAISARGSVVGSVAVYCLGITNTDPLWWNLPFERFLNKERNSFPDIDMDFQDDRRNEMFEYVREVYGKECCSNVVTFGKLTTKAAIRDVGRVMGIPLAICDKLSKMVTVKFGRVTKMKEMMNADNFPDFVNLVNSSEDLKLLVQNVQKVENLTRNTGMHACGFLITPEPIYDYIPVCFEKEGKTMMTQIVGQKLEDLGLMKFDFLGVANLSVVGMTLKFIEKYRGEVVDLQKIDIADKKTFKEVFQKADTNAVFQLESGGMKKYLKEMKPTTIRDIAALIALYRPGPIANIPEYIECKNGVKEVSFLIPESKEILEESYGVMVYQDQAMLMAIKAAGYSWGEADGLRKAMGKKIPELMLEQENKFKAGVMAKGYSQDIADRLFEQVKPFADYGFNKAHTAAYATLSYWTAYLKANYTLEFISALMQIDLENAEKLTRDILEAQAHGIEVLPPDINQSIEDFSIDQSTSNELQNKDGEIMQLNGKIRFGLGGLKSVGKNQVEEIVKARGREPFISLEDLLSRIDIKKVSKNAIEVLIKVGAMDSFGKRSQLLNVFLKAYEDTQKLSKSVISATLSMFGEEEISAVTAIKLPDIEEISAQQKVEWEKEYLGLYFSIHPLSKIKASLNKVGIKTLIDFRDNCRTGSKIKIAASIKKIRCVNTKKDNKKMCFGNLEDPDLEIEFAVFPTSFEKFGESLIEGHTYVFEGKKNLREDKYGILIDSAKEIEFEKFAMISDDLVEHKSNLGSKEVKNLKSSSRFTHAKSISTNKEQILSTPTSTVPINYTIPTKVINKYSHISITIPDSTELILLQKLNEYFLNNQGNGEITLIMKSKEGQDKKMILNTKLEISEKVNYDIATIIPSANILTK